MLGHLCNYLDCSNDDVMECIAVQHVLGHFGPG